MSIEIDYPIGSYVEVTDEDEEEDVFWRGTVRGYAKDSLWNPLIAPLKIRVDNGHPTEIDEHGFGRGWTTSAWVSPRNIRKI